jgi:hypothetical protein
MQLARPVFIGTFHKTGTILMGNIFERIAGAMGLRLFKPRADFWRTRSALAADFDILFDGASRFLRHGKRFREDWRGIVCIRDPRDLIVSAGLYHLNSPERWLHHPAERFGGKTYQEILRALPDDETRFLFEMDNSCGRTIERMLQIDQNNERTLVTSLDRLMLDCDLREFRRLFTHLGFSGGELESCLGIAHDCSVFSGKVETSHVRHTAPGFWKTYFTPALSAAFERRFPGAAEKLGYEPTFAEHV